MDSIHAYLPGWDVPKANKELLTDHFGLVSIFSRNTGVSFAIRAESMSQNCVFYGNALSDRDINAVNKPLVGFETAIPGGYYHSRRRT